MSPVDAACAVARQHGVVVIEPAVLSESNNVVVWLAPSRVVAKVGTGHHRRLDAELHIAEYLARVHAPVVGPAAEMSPRVHEHGGYEMTFWTYERNEDTELPPALLARSLHRLHEDLATMLGSLEVDLPSVAEELRSAGRLLVDPTAVPLLGSNDREMLSAVLASGEDIAVAQHVLHGSPHDMNILVVNGLPRFIDFETTCVGPLEWDLAHLGDDVAERYPHRLEPELLDRCRTLVSAKTAVWCWAKAAESPHMSWHARHHLNRVRESIASP